jgi:transcriptional regulator with XRE-family HTH domain
MRRRGVSMALPGTPGQRISDLCNGNHITQKELAEKIGVSASQLSRIVSGETRTVSNDILMGVAKEFKVSTDYILGLSTVSVRKSYDISELGLSEGAVRGLVTGAVDVQILNRLLEHKNFPKLIDLIRIYFQDTAAKGISARNQLIEIATASLSDLMKERPEHRTEARQDLQLLNAQKMGEHEAEIEKIKSVFLAILRDIKKDMENGEQPGETVTAAMFQTMRDTLAEQKQNPISVDDVTAMIAGQIGQLAPMDEETTKQFQALAKKMIEQAGDAQKEEKP